MSNKDHFEMWATVLELLFNVQTNNSPLGSLKIQWDFGSLPYVENFNLTKPEGSSKIIY
jgi:hypothetical protein